MNPLYIFSDNYAGVALCHAEIIGQILARSANVQLRDMLLTAFMGAAPTNVRVFGPLPDQFSRYNYSSATPPCWMLMAETPTVAYIAITGCQTPQGMLDAAHSYIYDSQFAGMTFSAPRTNPQNRPDFRSWGNDYLNIVTSTLTLANKHVRIVGHSLGGIIGQYIADFCPGPSNSIHLCTFGTPKCWENPRRFNTSVQVVRWVNPDDNVPRLPPAPAQAPDLYALLPFTESTRVRGWRHVCQGLQVSANGSITAVGDQPSRVLTYYTLQQAVQSPEGVTGRGHGIATYEAYLRQAYQSGTILPTAMTYAPQTEGAAPVPVQPMANTPPVIPDPLTAADVTARRVIISANASSHEFAAVVIPKPGRAYAIKTSDYWMIVWMNGIIAIAPTKKKARACVRHFNAFLHVFIGVGACDGEAFVGALDEWLASASDPANGFSPTLRTQGLYAARLRLVPPD